MFKLATWNVNSLRARQQRVEEWISAEQPDVVCLQETKVVDDQFPGDAFRRMGYSIAMAGQRTYNGVAILARHELQDVRVGLLGASEGEDKRILSARVCGTFVCSVYVPNGKSVDSPSFTEKLEWLARLRSTLDEWVSPAEDVAVCGDFNIAPEARDVYDPAAFEGHTHFHPREHEALARLREFGLVDAYRALHDEAEQYSWWDYRAGAFRRNRGLRIDLILASGSLMSRCREVAMHKGERGKEKPSDHIPVMATFGEPAAAE